MKTETLKDLYTPEGEALTGQPWQAYPRPQLRRSSFLNLNGMWDFAAQSAEEEPAAYSLSIRVPFAPESLLSGVHQRFAQGTCLFYRRTFRLPEGFRKERMLLHFGAVDQKAEVWLNGVYLGAHAGGYDSFTFDATDALREENTLIVRVTDELDRHVLPYGKQCEKRGGMWYTPVSGIWQTVWMESVCEGYIRELKIDADDHCAVISTGDASHTGRVLVETPEGMAEFPLENGCARVALQNPRLWSPEDPYLYRFAVETGDDRVESYFALRTLETKTVDGIPRLCLNGKPYFFHGLLDQGYWSDGLFTPAAPKCFARDILAMKKLGFNTLRKHIKVEPERFYYECDRLGMIVFQDMVNNGGYSFLRDTALPTVGLKRLPDKLLHLNRAQRAAFMQAMEMTVRQLRNHPCVCYWTIFNEGWGQFDADGAYRWLKKLDDTRFIDSASGWFYPRESDVVSHHVYFKPYRFRPDKKPVVLSEFGGYSFKPKGHVFNETKTYGYRLFDDAEKYRAAVEQLYRDEIVPAVKKGLCAAIYTQVSDVEDETNGLLSYDRKVEKLDAERMQNIAEELKI